MKTDYAAIHRLCKSIATHIEMAVSVGDNPTAKQRLKDEINADIDKLKTELNKETTPCVKH